MKTEPNEPANPFFTRNVPGDGDWITIEDKNGRKQFLRYKEGLTKREYFAAMAMQGITSRIGWDAEDAAKHAVNCADALINALNKIPTSYDQKTT